ncbi:MAG: phosphate acyltransferase PlsX [Chloroflexi bacterium]|nr:phosphate acyltransferase PlsX [Chloroflexota bacterium]MDA8189876.1 phosphate acyltransferase PlsX [Dehalococcoidales bacterium]
MKIAVDVMGGDLGPAEAIKGAMMAVREYDIEVALVGRQADIEAELARQRNLPSVSIVHADEVVEMREHPTTALRTKRNSSIAVGLNLVKEGQASAFVSPGNTGAIMAMALFTLGRIPGIERPALAIVFPTARGKSLLIDIGANADCKPSYLVQFALMGSLYLSKVFGTVDPKVGLLSIGEEETKGNQLVVETHALLKSQKVVNFIGNVEGKDIPAGVADVVVSDGFVGNVVVKLSEGLGVFLLGIIKEELTRGIISKALTLALLPNFKRVLNRVDYAEWGGSPLLGVEGVCIIAHGRSNAKAIKNAIRVAKQATEQGIVAAIKQGVRREET